MNVLIRKDFQPDYNNLVISAENRVAPRMPLYDHGIGSGITLGVLETLGLDLSADNNDETRTNMKRAIDATASLGYDTYSFECGFGPAMEGSGALGNHIEGCIKTMDDFRKYPWDSVFPRYFELYDHRFRLLDELLPPGMKAVGGAGYGVFENVQNMVGYMELCYIRVDDPELFAMLFNKIGDIMLSVWSEIIRRYNDSFCVYRFGDDLGFKSSTLISKTDIIDHVLPQYRKIISHIKTATGKPFLLHSCGNLLDVMDDIIRITGINAKHSNEDAIAPFGVWVERFGDRIALFGGVDCDLVCTGSHDLIRDTTRNVIASTYGKCGFALGTGNSVPDYIPLENYLVMNETARIARGE